MRFSSLWISVAWVTAAVAVVAGAPPPALTPLFTATLNVAAPLIVPIPGGVRSVVAIENGTLSGALQGTVTGGLAYPQLYNNQTLQWPTINYYGVTNDGVPFFITEAGRGTQGQPYTSLLIDIGGKYTNLSQEFILAHFVPNSGRTQVTITAWVVS